MSEPNIPPRTCAMTYRPPLAQEVWPVRQVAKVTAGFRWPPDTLAVMYTTITGKVRQHMECEHAGTQTTAFAISTGSADVPARMQSSSIVVWWTVWNVRHIQLVLGQVTLRVSRDPL